MTGLNRLTPKRITHGKPRNIEWPTLWVLVGCYGGWIVTTTFIANFTIVGAVILCSIFIVLHSSLQHEIIHGHPFPNRSLSEALVFPAIGLFIPYHRFRDLHLQHHYDPKLTDPYDDPESNFMDPEVWVGLPIWVKLILRMNNCLLGRMLLGPLISQYVFIISDYKLIRSGSRDVLLHWIYHFAALVLVLTWVWYLSPMSLTSYLIAAYLGLSLLKIRTFLEHRAHETPDGRTVVITDNGLLSFLFLNNNLHFVHHTHPAIPWYKLPQKFDQDKERYLGDNDGYQYKSYKEIFARYFLKPKDPVPHPLWVKND